MTHVREKTESVTNKNIKPITMDKIALILSIISLIISWLAFSKKETTKDFHSEPTKRGAVLFKPKTPEQVRLEKKLKKKQDFNIEDLW